MWARNPNIIEVRARQFHTCFHFSFQCANYTRLICGSTTTDRNKLTANQLTANKLKANNVDWLRRAILNIYLLSPEPSCPNPHFVTKWLRRHHVTKSLLRGQFVAVSWLGSLICNYTDYNRTLYYHFCYTQLIICFIPNKFSSWGRLHLQQLQTYCTSYQCTSNLPVKFAPV